jgi:hypothetical protein
MTDGAFSRHRREVGIAENLAYQAKILANNNCLAITNGNSGRLLASVLKRTQGEIGKPRNVATGRPDAKDAALVMQVFPRVFPSAF